MTSLSEIISSSDKRVDGFKLWLSTEYETLPSHLHNSIIFHLQLIAHTGKSSWKSDVDLETKSDSDVLSNLIDNIKDIIKHSLSLETTITFDESEQTILDSHEKTIDDQHQTITSMKEELTKIENENFILKEEYSELQNATKEMQSGILSEFSSLRAQITELERKNKELREELELAHRVRHDATIAFLTNTSELKMAIQGREKAEVLAGEHEKKRAEMSQRCQELAALNQMYQTDRQAAIEMNEILETRLQKLENELKRLDEAEAVMASSVQSRMMAEQRAARFEAEHKSLSEKFALTDSKLTAYQSELNKHKEENRMIADRLDYAAREKMVLQAELKAAGAEVTFHRNECVKLEQQLNTMKVINTNKSHEIEALLGEREEMEGFVRVLRTQLEEIQQQRERKERSTFDLENRNDETLIQNIHELRELLEEAEGKVQLYEHEREEWHQIQSDLCEEISKLQAENDVMGQMNHNLQLQLHSLQSRTPS
jgi:chromosome segregation ATPase